MRLLDREPNGGIRRWVGDLNRVYKAKKALHEQDCSRRGFRWVGLQDRDNSVISFLRFSKEGGEVVLADLQLRPCQGTATSLGCPGRDLEEVLGNGAKVYGGSGSRQPWAGSEAVEEPSTGSRHRRVQLSLPPLGMLLLEAEGQKP